MLTTAGEKSDAVDTGVETSAPQGAWPPAGAVDEEIVLETPAVPDEPDSAAPAQSDNVRTLADGRSITRRVNALRETTARKVGMDSMARHLRAFREEVLRVRQEDMAFLLGVSRMTYQRMENGHTGVAIDAWLRAMQLMDHLPTLTKMDLARDRAALAKFQRQADEHERELAALEEANPERFYG